MVTESRALTPLPSPDALLVVHGELPSETLLQRLGARVPVVIATDGAASRFLRATGCAPSVAVGDGDSVTDAEKLVNASRAFVLMPDQESGDLEKALGWSQAQGHRSLWLVGVVGRNPDHAFNNLSVLARWSQRVDLLLLHDGWWGIVLSRGSVRFAVPVGARVSLLPLPRVQLSTSGLRWELRDEALEFGVREGASNEAVKTEVSLDVHSGALFAYVEVAPPFPS